MMRNRVCRSYVFLCQPKTDLVVHRVYELATCHFSKGTQLTFRNHFSNLDLRNLVEKAKIHYM